MAVLYWKPCYNEACYNEVGLYSQITWLEVLSNLDSQTLADNVTKFYPNMYPNNSVIMS